jgi:hypothetical protein
MLCHLWPEGVRAGYLRSENLRTGRCVLQAPVDRPDSGPSGFPESLPLRRYLRAEDLRTEGVRASYLRSENLRAGRCVLQAPADRPDSGSSGLPESLPLRRHLRSEDLRTEGVRASYLRSENLRAGRCLLQASADRPDSGSSGLPESLPLRGNLLPGHLRACRPDSCATGACGPRS